MTLAIQVMRVRRYLLSGPRKAGRQGPENCLPRDARKLPEGQSRHGGGQRRERSLSPKLYHIGELNSELVIPCAVLEDGTRLLTQWGFYRAIGRSGSPAAGWGSDVEKVVTFFGPG